ncbi:MAG: radical SAM protein [Myxococcales bacterium]|nr:radical SAM protein [Myxococcales bacterium]
MGKLLSIETGFTCNSRCKYCTQLDYRVIPQADKLDLTTEQIKERIRFAAENGYDQLGFSGGEPTIRPDFVELIEYGRSFGFGRIGVTSNGRMFAYSRFTEQAMRAGLDGFTFSLHGPTSEIHDRISNSKGALEQALAGLRNIAKTRRKFGLEAHLMNNQILLPDNVGHISEMVELLAPQGVGLFMIQPFITQRSNSDQLGRFYVPYEDIVREVERAVPALRRHGARIKPYNVPNCLFDHLGPEFIEPQFYGLKSFREYEQSHPGEFKAFKAKQWYRIDACKTCEAYCPGFRVEQYPQDKMAAELVHAAGEFVARQSDPAERSAESFTVSSTESAAERLLFSGTELFDRATVTTAMTELAQAHGPVSWLTAFKEKVSQPKQAELICELTEAGQLDELIFITQPMDQRFLAQRVLEKGNLEDLRKGLFRLAELADAGRQLPKLRVLFNVGDLARLIEDPAMANQWSRLCKALGRASGLGTGRQQPVDAVIAISNFPRDQKPPDMTRQRADNLALARKLEVACKLNHMQPVLATLEDRRGLDAARAKEMATVEAQFAEVLPVESWARRLMRHPMSMPEMDFVSWSPPWLFERWDLSGGQQAPQAAKELASNSDSGLRTQPVAEIALTAPRR